MSNFTEVDETTEQLISILCAGYKGNYNVPIRVDTSNS